MDPLNFPIETLPSGWATALVPFTHRNGQKEQRIEIINLKTGIRYTHEPMIHTAIKCFELLIGTPIYLMGYVGWQIMTAPLKAAGTVLHSLSKFFTPSKKHTFARFAADVFLEAPGCFVRAFWAIVRAPFHAIAMEFAALYGVFRPLEGKVLVGKIEKSWHHPRTRRDDLFRSANPDDPSILLRALADKDFPHTFFLAYCMQPLGKLSDPHILRNEMEFLRAGAEPPIQGLFPLPA